MHRQTVLRFNYKGHCGDLGMGGGRVLKMSVRNEFKYELRCMGVGFGRWNLCRW